MPQGSSSSFVLTLLLLSQSLVPPSTQVPRQKTSIPLELLFLLQPLELSNYEVLEVYFASISLKIPLFPSLQPLL